jgi:hypothetical protein
MKGGQIVTLKRLSIAFLIGLGASCVTYQFYPHKVVWILGPALVVLPLLGLGVGVTRFRDWRDSASWSCSPWKGPRTDVPQKFHESNAFTPGMRESSFPKGARQATEPAGR